MVTIEKKISFNTSYSSIIDQIESFDPSQYGKTRNYIDGTVSRLSPYISRGVISTKEVLNNLLNRGFNPNKIEKYIQELAWRDYWQQVWIEKKDGINRDLKQAQQDVQNRKISSAIVEGNTGIIAVDQAIYQLYTTGYMHNHVRMYVASLACNIAKSHWMLPAMWMYYHLLDADWASNALSWQWIAGSNSKKKYFANQDNINRFCHTVQKGSFLDVEYGAFDEMEVPEILSEYEELKFDLNLPSHKSVNLDPELPILIYNFYNLDPKWRKNQEANRILLLEPSLFRNYPVSKLTIDFIIDLSKNIPGVQIYVGEFDELLSNHPNSQFYYKEHPLNHHYQGIEDPRDWMFSVKGYYSSFFSYWKRCKKELKSR